MKSNISKRLYFIFGATDEVGSFDEHHVLCKDYRYKSSENICHNIQQNLTLKIKSDFEISC